jgi:protein tyrosine phosphatase (PTP) superfamily phosphohydrolase (DUF442 family)
MTTRSLLAVLPAALLLVACSGTPAPTTSAAPASAPAEHASVLHNVHAIDPQLISGALPEGDAAFAELASMGVKTIISVDGAAPDVERAAAHGLRYVHIPITYAEVTEEETVEIARAIRDLPGPIYVHCHHGKHRSPAAAAAAAVALGRISADDGVSFMKTCGTAPNYVGLYASVAAMAPVGGSRIDGAPHDFPAVRTPQGIVGAMVDADTVFDHLKDISAAGWTVPADHPDLVPAAEAGRLVDLLRVSGEDPRARAHGAGFDALLAHAVEVATELETGIVAGAPKSQLDAAFAKVQASCKDCHAKHRDIP